MIAIVDYGAGNLKSVKKAFDFLQVDANVVSSGDELKDATKVVLPGVGAFGAAMDKLNAHGFVEPIRQWIADDKPFLGICLGLQMLFESSAETDDVNGLGAFKGTNLRFKDGKVPQIGWNQVNAKTDTPLMRGIENGSYFYFLHGYYIAPEELTLVTGETNYYITYPCMINRGKVYAVQFHPEKSGDVGIQLLKNWIENC
ncbi:imidazole glycerol phosphate synthase subunit HisH [candidate division KSB1 bacterium]|nr:imidazole glycerol phosphate synthase subunit HisH [candidate division KSB1 bacterium]